MFDDDEDEVDDIPDSEKDYHTGCGFLTASAFLIVCAAVYALISVVG